MEGRFRNWCFTDFKKPRCEEWELHEKMTYLIVGSEVCPETGKAHAQAYAEFKNPIGLGGLKRIYPGVHWEARRGDQNQAIEYCKKDGDFKEFGERKQQGKRADIEVVREMIKEGKADHEIVEEASSWQSVNGIQKMRQLMIKPRANDVKPRVKWVYGPTGTGKSFGAKKDFEYDYDDCDFQNGFLIGYTGNSKVLFDDFRGQVPLHTLLKMLDYGKCTVNVKNGSCFFGATEVVITSAFPPAKVYKNCVGENIDQLLRRIEILECTEVSAQKSGGNTKPPTCP
jgi:putative hemolysin